MPGRIMENGSMNGSHTNHERDKRLNGVGGLSNGAVPGVDKGKSRSEPEKDNSIDKMTPNGVSEDFLRDAATQQSSGVEEVPRDMISQLPPELLHISAGYLPLSKLLTRVTELTHNAVETTILELARMTPPSAINGNAAHLPNGVEDNSPENINKKKKLYDFALDTHTKFTKTLMLTKWSRKSEDVSKLIDLRVHLLNQTRHYDYALDKTALVKRDLGNMRVRNPDLRTATEILSTGKCSWLPELGYIEPPPLTTEEILKTLKNLNTLLSIRLNLHDYEKVPYHFKKFSIKSGRVTFRVAGEFELDLTIADEDPKTQFWFIDFRFLFTPRISQIPEALLFHIENRVNSILAQDDPLGNCYKFLHELVLTHKIAEIKKQAYDLNQGKWVGTLVVEPLQRALCIQYWHGRYAGGKGQKSWIIIGINSGKRKDGKPDVKATPRIVLRWFRDAKEVKDAKIPLNLDRISTEVLLKTVIAMHVEHILTSTHEKLKEVSLYKERDLALGLSISRTEPIESTIKLQVTHSETLTVAIEPVSGRITISPASASATRAEWNLNNQITDPAQEMSEHLMNFLRPLLVAQEIVCKSVSTGLEIVPNPGIQLDDVRTKFSRDTHRSVWFKLHGWKATQWYLVVGISTSGEEWKGVEIGKKKHLPPAVKGKPPPSKVEISRSFSLPMTAVSPTPSYAFFGTLQIYAATYLSHLMDISTIEALKIKYVLVPNTASVNSISIKVPKILIELKGLTQAPDEKPATANAQEDDKVSWAKNFVLFAFSGLELTAKRNLVDSQINPAPEISAAAGTPAANTAAVTPTLTAGQQPEGACTLIKHASVIVPSCQNLKLLGQHVDNDIEFHAPSGSFTIKISTPFGQPSITALQKRLRDVQRLVEFVEVMKHQKSKYTCESISLNKIVFTYIPETLVVNPAVVKSGGPESNHVTTYRGVINIEYTPDVKMAVKFEPGNPHLRMEDIYNENLRRGNLNKMFLEMVATFALLKAFDDIESSSPDFGGKATVSAHVRRFDLSHVQYRFVDQIKNGPQPEMPKSVRFEVSYRTRGMQHMWLVKRIRDAGDHNSPDEIDEILKPIWCKLGTDPQRPWKGLNTSAAAELPAIGSLLLAVDQVIKSYVNQADESGGDKNNEKEAKNVDVKEKDKQGPGFGSTTGQQKQQQQQVPQKQQQRGIAPPATMMAPGAGMNMGMQQRFAQMPPAQRQAAANIAQYRNQQQAAIAARLQRQSRQIQDPEVIELDD